MMFTNSSDCQKIVELEKLIDHKKFGHNTTKEEKDSKNKLIYDECLSILFVVEIEKPSQVHKRSTNFS